MSRALDWEETVGCQNGRPRFSQDQDRQLFAESAGTCLLCNMRLFAATGTRSVGIAERAHVVAHSDDGPRADQRLTPEERSDPANIVLLCPTCHTKVDKAPEGYSAESLKSKKAVRATAVARVGGTPLFGNREDARRAVEDVLQRNAHIFRHSGPDEDGALSSTEKAQEWTRLVMEDIVPSNELIVAIVELNRDLANDSDREAAQALRLHTQDLARKHATGNLTSPARRFPATAEQIFAGGM